MLLAFAIGGFVAGSSASLVRGNPHGAMNGLMVWAVAIPLMLFLLTGGIATALRTVGNVAGTAVQAAAPAAGQAAQAAAQKNPDAAAAQARSATQAVQQEATAMQERVSAAVTPQNVENAAQSAAPSAWWTLVSLLLAMGAAVIGGLAGGRFRANQEKARYHHHTPAMA